MLACIEEKTDEIVLSASTFRVRTAGRAGPAAPHFFILLACLLAVGCAATPPVQEMSDARQAVQAAREVDADRFAPQPLQRAEQHLEQATSRLDQGEYLAAREAAREAKRQAVYARDLAVQRAGEEKD